MAVILRNGASRAARNTPVSTIPIRSSKITVAQTGLISSLTGANNQTINAINLGYQGDNEVTQIQVKLWESAVNINVNYEAWIVFYNETDASSRTLSLSADGNDGEYSLLVPEAITSKPGNYQLYVVLNERTGHTEGGSGGVGVADDPAYRETFVSAGCKAVVNSNSGYSLLKDFNWENIYKYNKGVITIDDKEWVLDGNKYTTSIFLGGLDVSKSSEVNVVPPEGVDVEYSFEGESDDEAKTLILEATLVESLKTNILDKIKIEYPVIFNTPQVGSNYAQKIPIKVIQEPYSIAIDKNFNTTLGMKYDAYSTPIDVSGLINLPGTTEKYVIFKKDGAPIVCQAYGSYCWIPVSVTQEPGIWKVSFVGKDDKYVYYTDILKLPVVDNTLIAEDLKTDTIQIAATSSDAEKLYDSNSHAIHIIGSGEGNLSHTRDEIDYAIGWVKDVNLDSNGEQFSADRVREGIKYAEDWNSNKTSINTSISTYATEISNLKDQTNRNTTWIGEIEDSIADLDVTALEGRVTTAENNISTINSNISSLQTIDASHNSKILELEAADTDIKRTIKTNENNIKTVKEDLAISQTEIGRIKTEDIAGLRNKDEATDREISAVRGRLDGHDANIQTINRVLDGHAASLDAHNEFGTLIADETATRASEDTKLQIALENEITRATDKENDLSNKINENLSSINALKDSTTANFKTINDKLDTEIATRVEETTDLYSKTNQLKTTSESHTSQITGLQTRTETLESSVIKNDVNGSSEQLVLKIVFLKSEQEYESLETKDAGTLYLIQEEE